MLQFCTIIGISRDTFQKHVHGDQKKRRRITNGVGNIGRSFPKVIKNVWLILVVLPFQHYRIKRRVDELTCIFKRDMGRLLGLTMIKILFSTTYVVKGISFRGNFTFRGLFRIIIRGMSYFCTITHSCPTPLM